MKTVFSPDLKLIRGARDCAPYQPYAVGLVGRAVPCPPIGRGRSPFRPAPQKWHRGLRKEATRSSAHPPYRAAEDSERVEVEQRRGARDCPPYHCSTSTTY